MNRDAWQIYQTLCGRTVGGFGARGLLLERITQDWPLDALLDLLRRLDLIAEILQPETTVPSA